VRRLCTYPWPAGTAARLRTHPGSGRGAKKLQKGKCRREEREEKLRENLGVVFVMRVILVWAMSSAILDPLLNILTYQMISKW